MKMTLEDVKLSLMNPIYFMNVYLRFPEKKAVYTNTIYETLWELFISIFNPIENIDVMRLIQTMLDEKSITDKDLQKMIEYKSKFLYNYSKLYDLLEDDIGKLQKKICKSLHEGHDAKLIMNMYYRLLSNLEIDKEQMYSDFKSILLFEDDEQIKILSDHMSSSMNNVICNLMKKEGGLNEMKKEGNVVTEWNMDERGKIYFDIFHKDKVKVDKSKDKRNKHDLRTQVNEMDKEFGSNLKKPKIMIDDDYEYTIRLETLKMTLARMLFILNGVDSSNYIVSNTIFGTELRKIKINKDFKEESMWFDDISYDPKAYQFKARFLSYMINWVIKNLDLIAERCYYINKDSQFMEYEAKTEYVTYTVERLCDLIEKMLKGRSFNDDMIYFAEISIYLETERKDLKKNMKKIENLHEQSYLLSTRFKLFVSADDDISMDTLLKLSYMVSTNDPKIKNRIEFRDGYKFWNRRETYEMIEQLGEAISDSRDKYKIPKLFEFFVKSDPTLWSKFNDVNNNHNLLVGMVALKYYAFVVNDRRITNKVTCLTER